MNPADRIAEMIDFGPDLGQSNSIPVGDSDIPTHDIRMQKQSNTCLRSCSAQSCINWDNGICALELVTIDDCGCCAMFCQDENQTKHTRYAMSSGSDDLMDFISDLIGPDAG